MKGERWLAAFIAMTGLLLVGNGCFTVGVIDFTRTMQVGPNGSWPTAEFVAIAQSTLPSQYLIAAEGILFGAIAMVSAVGFLTRQPWAWRIVLPASALLAIVAAIAIAMTPREWDTQGVFIVMCSLLWWQARRRGHK